LAAEKFALLPTLLKHFSREALFAASVRFLACCSGKSGQPLIINEVDLDAAAFGLRQAVSQKPQQSRTRTYTSWKPAGLGRRQARPRPTEAERWNGRYGSRPSGGAY
jgi:hypothetical protein